MATQLDTQVVVVGAGPVGLMLAGELRLGGADVVVLERLTAPSTQSRASTLHARTMEILDQRGLLASLGSPPVDLLGHFGGIPLDFSRLPTPFPGQWKVPQARLAALLEDWSTGQWPADGGATGTRTPGPAVDLRRGHQVTALADAGDHVEVTAVGPAGRVTVLGAFAVGCDGEQSTVAELGGFGFAGTDAGRELLQADVAGIEIPARRFERLPGGLAIAARRPDGVTRVMVHELGAAAAPRAGGPLFAEVVKAWERVTGEDISDGTALWLNAFGDASRQAEQYRRGRILLAGDAAHQQLPVGGQALNLGLADAVNLGWKLAAQVAGTAPDSLLDSYHAERHEAGRQVLRNIAAQTLLLLGGSEVDAARTVLAELIGHHAVTDRLAAMISGLDARYSHDLADHPLTGHRLRPGQLQAAGGPVTVAELLRPGRWLLADLSPAGPLQAAAAPWADRITAVTAMPAPGGPLDGVASVLVRPDGHVAWAAAASPEAAAAGPGLDAALRRWFGPPSSSRVPPCAGS